MLKIKIEFSKENSIKHYKVQTNNGKRFSKQKFTQRKGKIMRLLPTEIRENGNNTKSKQNTHTRKHLLELENMLQEICI